MEHGTYIEVNQENLLNGYLEKYIWDTVGKNWNYNAIMAPDGRMFLVSVANHSEIFLAICYTIYKEIWDVIYSKNPQYFDTLLYDYREFGMFLGVMSNDLIYKHGFLHISNGMISGYTGTTLDNSVDIVPITDAMVDKFNWMYDSGLMSHHVFYDYIMKII